ncbi:MAG: HNH endonuclease [bacterium]
MFELIEYFANYGFNKCVSKDTIIEKASGNQYSPKKVTIEKFYNDWHSDRAVGKKYRNPNRGVKILSICNDGRVRPRKVKNVFKTGNKKVYEIKCKNGKKIKATQDHKFLVNGDWVKVKDLNLGDNLLIKGKYEKTNKNYSFSDKKQNNNNIVSHKGHKGFYEGELNPGYIDGSYIEYQENKEKVIERANGKCEICNSKNDRMEFHHIDEDRNNNSLDNLMYLCVSCHKKEYYNSGRNKKWDKGYPVYESEIVEIEFVGEEMTYDIEMGSDNELGHNYIANDIVTHNSHSACYATISYVTAFLKYYFASEFYSSLLSFEANKTFTDSSIKEYIADCYARKINILPPDINKSDKDFKSVDGDILFGLNIIKGVGEKAVDEIINHRPYKDVYDMVNKVDNRIVNKTVVEAIIKSGAFDFYNDNRKSLIDNYLNDKNNNANTMSLFGEEHIETTKEDIIEFEREVLNISLTYPNRWLMVRDREPLSLTGKIHDIKKTKTKNDNEMAFMKLKTRLDDIKCVVFPRQYSLLSGSMQEGQEVLVDGRKNGNSFQVNDIKWTRR